MTIRKALRAGAAAERERVRDPRFRRYARLLVRVAINVQPRQRLIVWKAPVEAAPFIRLLAEDAYRAGASYVDVLWKDDRLELERITRPAPELLRDLPRLEIDLMETAARRGEAFLFFDCTCAGAFDGASPELVALALQLETERVQGVWSLFVRNRVNWSIVTVPTESRARKVYPAHSASEGLDRLWEDVFAAARVNEAGFGAAWRRHRGALERRSRLLNELHLATLRFEAPGTDLLVRLPVGHLWNHLGFHIPSRTAFVADVPFEEVFTLPDRSGVGGQVQTTRPLVVNGHVVSSFSLRFQDGRVAGMDASPSDRVLLEKLLAADEGAARLGEVALVPEDSIVARRGRLFFNTLFDENASCHLALGRAYRFCLKESENLSNEAFRQAGGNNSAIHVDFMIGSRELNVTGVDRNGHSVPILRSGLWAPAE